MLFGYFISFGSCFGTAGPMFLFSQLFLRVERPIQLGSFKIFASNGQCLTVSAFTFPRIFFQIQKIPKKKIPKSLQLSQNNPQKFIKKSRKILKYPNYSRKSLKNLQKVLNYLKISSNTAKKSFKILQKFVPPLMFHPVSRNNQNPTRKFEFKSEATTRRFSLWKFDNSGGI